MVTKVQSLRMDDDKSPVPWDGRWQCYGCLVAVLCSISFLAASLPPVDAGLALRFCAILALPFTLLCAHGALKKADHRHRSFCCSFLTASAMIVSLVSLRFLLLTTVPPAIAGPLLRLHEGLEIFDYGWMAKNNLTHMVQVDGRSCMEHIRHEKLKRPMTACGSACACTFMDGNANKVVSWNFYEHLPEWKASTEGCKAAPKKVGCTAPDTDSKIIHSPMFVFPEAAFLHILPSISALALGPLQHNEVFRKNSYLRHRIIGWIYAVSIVAGASGAYYLSLVSTVPLWSVLGFVVLASAWLITLAVAIISICQRPAKKEEDPDLWYAKVHQHRLWMTRNYGLTFAATTLRWQMTCMWTIFGQDLGYALLSWTSWVPNLLIIEAYIHWYCR
eukprot:TRINITY_DN43147_c0_g1_i1.p1 TRINITY_DN43147_c0_g1~~TRINITY_DN43147_c0_g1_i1.p1  ORF type:complete len:389 (+),score=32.72 TRINITY_DN43147_c0_g1_i1:65-1231(+)